MTDWGKRAETLLRDLAGCSEPGPGVTRLPFTPEHQAALDVLSSAMTRAGLQVTLDDAGSLIGRYEGPAGCKTLLMGSHQDSVREGGAYDGIMGVALPVLALEKLREEQVELPFSVEVIAFADEEGVRFPTALVGSRALAGTFDPAVLEMRDRNGIALGDAMASFGLTPENIGALARRPDQIIGFLETHIEQGPVLERENEAVGVVTAICGIERHQIEIIGETGHAGTMPMDGRRDALVAAAAFVLDVNRLGTKTADLRATVGAMTVEPNVVNAVPRAVRLTVELRSPHDAIREAAGRKLMQDLAELAEQQQLTVTASKTYAQVAQPCDQDLTSRLVEAGKQCNARAMALPSGATHDASAMADLCPIAMLFVRCRDGISHRPEEFASPQDMAQAICVLEAFLKAQEG